MDMNYIFHLSQSKLNFKNYMHALLCCRHYQKQTIHWLHGTQFGHLENGDTAVSAAHVLRF